MKIKAYVKLEGHPTKYEEAFEVDDDSLTDQEIEQIVYDWMSEHVDWGWRHED